MIKNSIKSLLDKLTLVAENSTQLLVLFFALIVLSGSFGQVARWDLLDQVSKADNYLVNGLLYPPAEGESPFGVSVYFPGVSLLAILLEKIGVDFFLVETLLLLACFALFSFLVIQIKLFIDIFHSKESVKDFFPTAILCALVLSPNWLSYAREFKPDTIAYVFGFLGLFFGRFFYSKSNFYRAIVGGVFFGAALIFKQQYLSLILGALLFALISRSPTKLAFSLSSLVVASFIVSYIYIDQNAWFWTVTVLSDDGFITLRQLISDNLITLATLLVAISFYKIADLIGAKDTSSKVIDHSIKGGWHSLHPWICIVLPSVLVAFAGAVKVGGNAGNTQFGLMLLLPFILLASLKVDKKIIIIFAWLSVFLHLTTIYSGPKKYSEAIELRTFIEKNISCNTPLVITGSDVYFASRVLRNCSKIINYWSEGVRSGVSYESILPKFLATREANLLVVENIPENKVTIKNDSRYTLLFENRLGLVAGLQNSTY